MKYKITLFSHNQWMLQIKFNNLFFWMEDTVNISFPYTTISYSILSYEMNMIFIILQYTLISIIIFRPLGKELGALVWGKLFFASLPIVVSRALGMGRATMISGRGVFGP